MQMDLELLQLLQQLPQAANTKLHENGLLLPALERMGILKAVHPVHADNIARKLDPAQLKYFPHIDAIRDYYGEGMALYFAWMNFMLKWLCLPAICGVIVFLLSHTQGALL